MTKDRTTPLIAVSPEVDRLLSAQRIQDAEVERSLVEGSKEERVKQIEEMMRNPVHYYPGRNNFLSAMAQQPAAAIPPSSYLRLLEDSKIKCSKPIYTTNFIKVRVTSGSLEGSVGWVCEDSVFRTVPWP
jgi:hypothetical protein